MWRIIQLDDGRQWLTDGTIGMAPEASPALLEACRAVLDAITQADY